MDYFLVRGPSRLAGIVEISGAKNASLPALAACLLTDDDVVLERLPPVRDILTMMTLLEHLGTRVTRGEQSAELRASDLSAGADAPYDLVKTMRASVLVLGPLLARTGRARVSLPGGCAIGVRPIDQHLAGLEALGAEVTLEHGYVTARASRLRGSLFRFARETVTGTENLMMAAVLAEGSTVLENCAREPEITDLANLLRAMGAQISGDGSHRIEIEGVASLGGATHEIVADRIEAGTYLVAGALTNSEIVVQGARRDHLAALITQLEAAGVAVEDEAEGLVPRLSGSLRATDVMTAPHPGFPTDLQAQFMSLMTQAEGTSQICETIFENRFQHVAELNRMGASIEIDGSIARVHGPTQLSAANVMATDLRASACLVIAALTAAGETRIDRIYHLDRGYHRMESKLQNLGAEVQRVGTATAT